MKCTKSGTVIPHTLHVSVRTSLTCVYSPQV